MGTMAYMTSVNGARGTVRIPAGHWRALSGEPDTFDEGSRGYDGHAGCHGAGV